MASDEIAARRRLPTMRAYVRWFHGWEWRWHRSVDEWGPVWQINFGWVGVTLAMERHR